MNSLTDNAVMLAVKDGQTEQLGLLYERYKTWIFNFFLQMNGDRNLSEDLVQNVFMRILQYKHTYTIDSNFVTWMFQIARNVSHDHFRKTSKKGKETDLETVSYKIVNDYDIESVIEKKESSAQLYMALKALPIEKREVIVLSKLKQLRYKEVGAILGCSEDAARTKAHRALAALKTVYFSLQT